MSTNEETDPSRKRRTPIGSTVLYAFLVVISVGAVGQASLPRDFSTCYFLSRASSSALVIGILPREDAGFQVGTQARYGNGVRLWRFYVLRAPFGRADLAR